MATYELCEYGKVTFFNKNNIQVRKHKKRRTNKKWLKKYGHKENINKYIGEINFKDNFEGDANLEENNNNTSTISILRGKNILSTYNIKNISKII